MLQLGRLLRPLAHFSGAADKPPPHTSRTQTQRESKKRRVLVGGFFFLRVELAANLLSCHFGAAREAD